MVGPNARWPDRVPGLPDTPLVADQLRPAVANRFSGIHADGHDVRAMVLLVANRGRKVP